MYTIQPPLLALKDFLASDSNDRLVLVLDTLDLEPLLARLDRRGGRGRRGYSVRSMLYAVIAGWVYNLHSMAELRRELVRNGSLRILCGIHSVGQVPSEDALSRFFARLADLGKETPNQGLTPPVTLSLVLWPASVITWYKPWVGLCARLLHPRLKCGHDGWFRTGVSTLLAGLAHSKSQPTPLPGSPNFVL